MTNPEEQLSRITVTEWVANLGAGGATMSDEAWETERDELLDNFKTILDEARSNIRAKFLDSIIRQSEEENP